MKNRIVRLFTFAISYYPFYILISTDKWIMKIGSAFGIVVILSIALIPFKDEK
jgi:hypothetical protein